jgi:hypothetical protein
MDDTEGGASVVVGARESRAQGEGKQEEEGRFALRRSDLWTRITRQKRPGYSAFSASSINKVRHILTKHGGTCGGWLTDLRMIRHSWRRVASNKGKRSAGIDGITVKHIQQRVGEECFLEGLRTELRSGAYRPSPARRKLIPKAGKPGRISRPKSHKHSSPRLCEAGSFLAWSTSGLTLGKVRGTRTLYRRTRF